MGRWKEREERGGEGSDERGFFREEGRRGNESLEAEGSLRNCSERKESRPMVGREEEKSGRMEKRRRVRVRVSAIDGGSGDREMRE